MLRSIASRFYSAQKVHASTDTNPNEKFLCFNFTIVFVVVVVVVVGCFDIFRYSCSEEETEPLVPPAATFASSHAGVHLHPCPSERSVAVIDLKN